MLNNQFLTFIYIVLWTTLLTGCATQQASDAEVQHGAAIDASTHTLANELEKTVWQKATLRGVNFRAVGQEPGWLLEIIEGDTILLVTNYGQTKTTYVYIDPLTTKQTHRTFNLSNIKSQPSNLPDLSLQNKVTVLIETKVCSDSMSGEEFEFTTIIQFFDVTLKGCGRAL